jgi:5-oxoprolinase (ATP-hydrolysing) subunit A
MNRIDLNCDMGESFGNYRLGNDELLLDYVTSANIACGYHAGDPSVMRKTTRMALDKGVAVGAHPGYPDLQGFGRRDMDVTAEELHDMVVYQVGALLAIVRGEGGMLEHVKAHGALYNAAQRNHELAEAIAHAVVSVDPSLILLGLPDRELVSAGQKAGLRTANEAFADRSYEPDGTLSSRRQEGAVIADPDSAAEQCIGIVRQGVVRTREGAEVHIAADTICLHGDNPRAPEFARAIRTHLEQAGIRVTSLASA